MIARKGIFVENEQGEIILERERLKIVRRCKGVAISLWERNKAVERYKNGKVQKANRRVAFLFCARRKKIDKFVESKSYGKRVRQRVDTILYTTQRATAEKIRNKIRSSLKELLGPSEIRGNG